MQNDKKDKIHINTLVEYIDLFGMEPVYGIVIDHYYSEDWEDECFVILCGNYIDIIPRFSICNFIKPT